MNLTIPRQAERKFTSSDDIPLLLSPITKLRIMNEIANVLLCTQTKWIKPVESENHIFRKPFLRYS